MCEFHDCNCNGLGDIWWTDKCMYFSSIDIIFMCYIGLVCIHFIFNYLFLFILVLYLLLVLYVFYFYLNDKIDHF